MKISNKFVELETIDNKSGVCEFIKIQLPLTSAHIMLTNEETRELWSVLCILYGDKPGVNYDQR